MSNAVLAWTSRSKKAWLLFFFFFKCGLVCWSLCLRKHVNRYDQVHPGTSTINVPGVDAGIRTDECCWWWSFVNVWRVLLWSASAVRGANQNPKHLKMGAMLSCNTVNENSIRSELVWTLLYIVRMLSVI